MVLESTGLVKALPQATANRPTPVVSGALHAPKQTDSIDLLSDIPLPSEELDEDYLPTDGIQRQSEAEEDTETEDNLPAAPRPRSTKAHTKNQ